MINNMLVGAIAMASLIVSLYFLRFWRDSQDRFFLYFAFSFFLEGVNRIIVSVFDSPRENDPVNYLIRLLAYSLILIAVIEKNWPNRPKK